MGQSLSRRLSRRPNRSEYSYVIDEHRRWENGVGRRITVERATNREIQDHEERLIEHPRAESFHVATFDRVVQSVVDKEAYP